MRLSRSTFWINETNKPVCELLRQSSIAWRFSHHSTVTTRPIRATQRVDLRFFMELSLRCGVTVIEVMRSTSLGAIRRHGQDIDGRVQRDSGFWHAVDGTRRFVLRDCVVTAIAKQLHTTCTILSHSGQKHADGLAAPMPADALEQHVDRRPIHMMKRFARICQPLCAPQNQMIARASHEHASMHKAISVSGDAHAQSALI